MRRAEGQAGEVSGGRRLWQEKQQLREFVGGGNAQGWEGSRRGNMGAMKVEKNHGLVYHRGDFLMAGSYSWPGAFHWGVFDRREFFSFFDGGSF